MRPLLYALGACLLASCDGASSPTFSVQFNGSLWQGTPDALLSQGYLVEDFLFSASNHPAGHTCSAAEPCERLSIAITPAPERTGTFRAFSALFVIDRGGENGQEQFHSEASGGNATVRITRWGKRVEGEFYGTLVHRLDPSRVLRMTDGHFEAPLRSVRYTRFPED